MTIICATSAIDTSSIQLDQKNSSNKEMIIFTNSLQSRLFAYSQSRNTLAAMRRFTFELFGFFFLL
jgi:hypothetical protein